MAIPVGNLLHWFRSLVLWVWSDHSQLTAKFSHAIQLSIKLFGKSALSSFQGMTLALVNRSGAIVPILWAHLHQRMEQVAGKHWRVGKWLPLACDGSYFSTPRTIKNEKAFSFKGCDSLVAHVVQWFHWAGWAYRGSTGEKFSNIRL
jgi:hypothetical protein